MSLIASQTGDNTACYALPRAPGTGAGAALINPCAAAPRGLCDVKNPVSGSQCHAIGIYEKPGFCIFDPVYDDAGIAHRDVEFGL